MSLEKLTWTVKEFDCNAQKICDYDMLRYETASIKKIKKESANIDEFAKELASHLKWQYWSRAEWELVLVLQDNKVLLAPWCGCYKPDEATIDVTRDESFDWKAFAQTLRKGRYSCKSNNRTEIKFDVWDQINYQWDAFVNYCWTTRLKYERIKN